MEVVKAFNSNNLHTEIVIKGTYDKPLFRASDVGNVLEMGNVRTSISNFDDTEKVVHTMDTLGGKQDVTFLTEKGLYKVLFKSRKPIAEKFQNWVCEIITEIRLNGKYELEKQLEQAKNEIVQIEETNKKELDDKVLREREKMLLHLVNTNIKTFNNNVEYLRVENETLKQIIASSNQIQEQYNSNDIVQELLNTQKEMMKIIQNLEKSNREILEKMNSMQTKTATGFEQPLVTLGPRLQKINPENLNLIKIYESVAECMKESNFIMKRPSIDKAVKENTIYQGYRWMYIERDKDPNVIDNIIPTKVTKIQNLGYIAKLNSEKNEILNIYLDRKTAATSNGYESSSALDTPVKNGTLTKGNYYMLFDKCQNELKQTFIEKYGEPLLYKDGIGQFNSNGILVKEFICKYDCIKQLQMSDKTLTKALDQNIAYNSHYFKSIGSKLKHL